MDLIEHNREAWNKIADEKCLWSQPVSDEAIASAKEGEWQLTIAGPKPVPPDWFGEIKGKSILCLASGGGQQAPILVAAGATVTSLDLSEEQLAKDREVCARNGLDIHLEQGSMTNLSRFKEASFDLIFNPVSNPYVPNINEVWSECHRVLKPGGRLLAGSINPLNYLFEENDGSSDKGLNVKFRLPFVEIETLTEDELQKAIDRKMIFTWSHSLEDIIDGQMRVGFRLAGLFESKRNDQRAPAINKYAPTYIATLAIKDT